MDFISGSFVFFQPLHDKGKWYNKHCIDTEKAGGVPMKKICVIMIGFHSEYARMTTEGMTDQAAVLGYQIYVHSYFGLRLPTEKTFAG